jgi:hypothetical protein
MTQLQESAWQGEGVSVADVERRLGILEHPLRDAGAVNLRTSVLTHLAWVPPHWERAALDTLAGLGDRHPSRAILLLPQPDAHVDRIDARVALRSSCPPGYNQYLCSEVIELRLLGRRTAAPASIVAPLLIPDLPVFLRWRGQPPFGEDGFEGMLDLVDRLIVDSSEWEELPRPYAEWAERFKRAACSDIAWRRTEPWRVALARLWPGIAELRELRARGPLADVLLLAGWLRSRLGRDVELSHEPAAALEAVSVDGDDVERPDGAAPTGSDLLSDELDEVRRDRVYEAAVAAVEPKLLSVA